MSGTAHRAATRRDHNEFCVIEDWKLLRTVSHHRTYTLTLMDGRILRTRISHPVGRDSYAPSMLSHILRDQLECTKDQFFQCADHKILPPRPTAPNSEPQGLDLKVVYQLKHALNLPDAEIMKLTVAQAHQLLADHYNNLQM